MTAQTVQKNSVVYIIYSIVDANGAVVQQHDVPVGYVQGGNSGLFEKIERELEGHAAGERVEVVLPPADGFGEHQPELAFTDSIANVPPQFHYVGAEVTFQNENGEDAVFRVTRIENGKLTVDGNLPLAGQTVTCVVDIVSVRDATRDEVLSGVPQEGAAPLH
jgi:FKBP-type peptidyl-prolyl cis-trans isomerase SlyD